MYISPHVRRLIDLALDEDDIAFDATSVAFFSDVEKTAQILAKEDLIVCGIGLVEAVFDRVDPRIEWRFDVRDGDAVKDNTVFGRAKGSALSLLRGGKSCSEFHAAYDRCFYANASFFEHFGGIQNKNR